MHGFSKESVDEPETHAAVERVVPPNELDASGWETPLRTPLELVFRHAFPTEEMRRVAHERVARLEAALAALASCHVSVEGPAPDAPADRTGHAIRVELRLADAPVARGDQRCDGDGAGLREALERAFDAAEQGLGPEPGPRPSNGAGPAVRPV